MKKIVAIVSVFFWFGSIGQTTFYEQDSEPQIKAGPKAKPATNNNQKSSTPFYTEDFGGGYPAGWTTQDTSGVCPWSYSTDGTWGYFNGNNATAAAAGINSTTAANGFLICDVDSANHFTNGQPSGSNYQYLSTYFTSSAINCSSHNSVVLKFEQLYRYNNGVAMNVKVSNDGVTWTTFNVANGVANNATSANPASVSLNITAIAANQPTVYLRFGWSARVYYWMIDDITLSELDPFDLATDDSWWGMGTFNNQNYKIPLSHAAPITFYTRLTNSSTSVLSGSTAATDISGNLGSVFSGSSTPINLAVATSDTVSSSTTWTPSAIGMYDMTTVSSSTAGPDGNLTNNTFQDSLEITSSVFGLDNLTSPSQSTGSISNFSTNTGLPFKIGNVYQVTIDDFIQCVQIGITNYAQSVGKEVFAEIYAYDPVAGDFIYRGGSINHIITTGELGTIISLPMTQNADVYADEEILVVACHYGGNVSGADDVRFMYGQGVPEQTVYGYNDGGSLLYLSNPRAIVVRPDFNCGNNVGLSETNQLNDATVFPNPTKDEFTISLSSEINGGNITLCDLNGRIV
ncbi:MAG: hypothetical protein ACSHXL_04885, partial [Bacteroidota bacterium]